MGRAVLALTLSGALAVSLSVRSGQTAVPLAVTISRLQMVAPGRVGFEVTIAGLRPELTDAHHRGNGDRGGARDPRAAGAGAGRPDPRCDRPAGGADSSRGRRVRG